MNSTAARSLSTLRSVPRQYFSPPPPPPPPPPGRDRTEPHAPVAENRAERVRLVQTQTLPH